VSIRKFRDKDDAYATYKAGEDWEWRVLKVNQPSKSPLELYSTWMVAARSPMTFGSWEMGDTYAHEMLRFGELVESTPEFRAYINKWGAL
jgi:hypothetical protein